MANPELPKITIAEALKACGFTEKKELAGLCCVDASTVTRWGELVPPAHVPMVLAYIWLKTSSTGMTNGNTADRSRSALTADRGVGGRGASVHIGHETWLGMSTQEKADFYDRIGLPPLGGLEAEKHISELRVLLEEVRRTRGTGAGGGSS